MRVLRMTSVRVAGAAAALLATACLAGAGAAAADVSPGANVARGPGVIDAGGDVDAFQVVGNQLIESQLTSSGSWLVGAIATGTFTCIRRR